MAKKNASSNAAEDRRGQSDDTSRIALAIAEAGLDKKALQIEIIDVRGKVDYADYVVVMSGRSDRQVKAIANGVVSEMKKRGLSCESQEGMPHGNWVLVDFGDVVVHVFHEELRGYYDLESLWMDAARLDFEGQEEQAPPWRP